ncbi:HEAT repeat domain-containing protein [Burkholderiaceae bacterium DAT-1]|nr:HEAT repeat domain-containing protein [Burkholderiaceae bacterium DAT-1]
MTLIRKQLQDTSSSSEERKQPRDCASLVISLGDTESNARRWAARDLVDCPGASIHLVDRLKVEADPSVRAIIFSSLTCIGDAVAVDGLVEQLRSEDANLRNEAIEAMKQLPEQVAPIMKQLLHDADGDVRIFAVNVLESLRHPEVEHWLIDVIEQDPGVNVCATAVDLLGEVGSNSAKAALQGLKQRFADEPYIQFAADLALKRIAEN